MAFMSTLNRKNNKFVEKKQLNVSFLQIVVDIAVKSDYYCVIVIRKSNKR